jgi:hypothetical protein
MLTGTAIKTINLWTTSLSKAKGRTPEDRIMKEGTKKQCTTQANDMVIANLSVVN